MSLDGKVALETCFVITPRYRHIFASAERSFVLAGANGDYDQ
jgi:hypothetical protein